MTKTTKKIFFFFCVICFFLLSAGFTLALEVHYPEILGKTLNDTSTIAEYLCYLFGFGTTLVISLTVIIIAYGGVLYLISYGSGKFTSDAKEVIKAGISGLLIVTCASLILYTINPQLVSCEVAFLSKINFNPVDINNTDPALRGIATTTYQEIPIGILTENLLTRTMDCYDFDQSGNPVDRDSSTKEVLEPTLLQHDRVDCLTKLFDASQNKAWVISELGNKITELMETCNCKGKCTSNCAGCHYTQCPGGSCVGPCVGAQCNPGDCCPTGVKDAIEHGPVKLSFEVSEYRSGCPTAEVEYLGLDEFRCPNPKNKNTPCSNIVQHVETQKQLYGRNITIIDKKKWGELNLWQQLTYFKEKMEKIREEIQKDKTALDNATTTLGSCYLAIPYVDLEKNYENANQKNQLIFVAKTFSDPITNEIINISKYCEGFNYGNSSCLKKCNDLCPDNSGSIIGGFRGCGQCAEGNAECLNKQLQCIKKAYNSRQCWYSDKSSENFGECIASCQENCTDVCAQKYPVCSLEYKFCESQCKDNGQCVLDNSDSCLLDSNALAYCSNTLDANTDQGNIEYCINKAYICKNGSNEYSSYPDCAKPVKCPADQKKCEETKGCTWNESNSKCQQDYSTSFLFGNPDFQKCQDPYNPAKAGSSCFSNESPTSSCQEVCPETAKCLTASRCPGCECNKIDETLSYRVPIETTEITDEQRQSMINFLNNVECVGCANNQNRVFGKYNVFGDYSITQEKILAYEITSAQCNEYAYNDDPMTFYCMTKPMWYDDPLKEGTNPTPIGEERICPKAKEIPIGQTINDAKNWVDSVENDITKVGERILEILDQMKKIGEAKNASYTKDYCTCVAKMDDGTQICSSDCQFKQVRDKFGNYHCSCTVIPCQGSPCRQMIDYMAELWNYFNKFKLEFIDLYTAAIEEPRSDIIKELNYSRKGINECSLENTAHGAQVRLLNCTRVKDEIISPVNTGDVIFDEKKYNVGCFGNDLSDQTSTKYPLSDNWFCCEENSKNPSKNSNPIYNIK